MNRFGAGLLLAFALACGGEDSSSIIVELRTDLVPGIEFDAFELIDGERALEREVGSDEIGGDWTASRPMGELETEPGTRRMRVRLRRAGTEIIGRDLTVVVEGRTGVQVVFTRDCTGVSCAEGEACFAGQCVPDGCISGLEPTCGFTPECATDSECIASNMCAPLVCEPPGYCFPARFECPDQQYCDETTGCTPLRTSDGGVEDGGGEDASTSDAGPSDAGPRDAGGGATSERTWVGSIIAPNLRAPTITPAAEGFVLAFEADTRVDIVGGGASWGAFLNASPSLAIAWLADEALPSALTQLVTITSSRRVEHQGETPSPGSIALDCVDEVCAYAVPTATDGLVYQLFGDDAGSGSVRSGLSAFDLALLPGHADGARVAVSYADLADPFRIPLLVDTGFGVTTTRRIAGDRLYIARDGSEYVMASAFGPTLADEGFDDTTTVYPPGRSGTDIAGVAVYLSGANMRTLYAGDPAAIQVLDIIATGDASRPYAMLLTLDATSVNAPAGSPIGEFGTALPWPRPVILELDDNGLLLGGRDLGLSSANNTLSGALFYSQDPTPHYRIAFRNGVPGGRETLVLFRLDAIDGSLDSVAILWADDLAAYAFRDERDLYVVGAGAGPVTIDGIDHDLDPAATGYVIRHSIDPI